MENNSFSQSLEDFENKFEDLSGNFEIYLDQDVKMEESQNINELKTSIKNDRFASKEKRQCSK